MDMAQAQQSHKLAHSIQRICMLKRHSGPGHEDSHGHDHVYLATVSRA